MEHPYRVSAANVQIDDAERELSLPRREWMWIMNQPYSLAWFINATNLSLQVRARHREEALLVVRSLRVLADAIERDVVQMPKEEKS